MLARGLRLPGSPAGGGGGREPRSLGLRLVEDT